MPRVSIWDIISLVFGLKEKLETEEIVQVDDEREITNAVKISIKDKMRVFDFPSTKTLVFPPYCFWGVCVLFFQGWNSNAGR